MLALEADTVDTKALGDAFGRVKVEFELDVLITNTGFFGTLGSIMKSDWNDSGRIMETSILEIFLCTYAYHKILVH